MKALLPVTLIIAATTANAADYYVDMDVQGFSEAPFLPIEITRLSLDLTSTGRYFQANGYFYVDSLESNYPTDGTCIIEPSADIRCNLGLNVSIFSQISVDVIIDSGGGIGTIFARKVQGTAGDIVIYETGYVNNISVQLP